jgi:hypothetical protein
VPFLCVGKNEVPGIARVELIDLVALVEYRHVPLQEVDEDAFARLSAIWIRL